MAIASDTKIGKTTDFIESEVDDETILMHLDQGSFLSLKGTGQRIWSLLDEPASIDGLVAALVREFDIDEASCRADVAAFVGRLDELGLVNAVD